LVSRWSDSGEAVIAFVEALDAKSLARRDAVLSAKFGGEDDLALARDNGGHGRKMSSYGAGVKAMGVTRDNGFGQKEMPPASQRMSMASP
jgi:hypothetical protein